MGHNRAASVRAAESSNTAGLAYHIRGRADGNKVALTFDDGPNPPCTEQILDILASQEARATFFLIGKWVERWPRTVERIAAGGHAIGNHSYLHAWHICDYDLAEASICHVIGKPTKYIRAQSFDYDACALSPLSRDHYLIDASVNPADWALTEPKEVLAGVMNDPELDGGAIIDLHDGWEIDDVAQRLRRPQPMIEALPKLIVQLRDQGYQLVTLDELVLDEPLYWRGARDPRDVVQVRKGQLMTDTTGLPTRGREVQ